MDEKVGILTFHWANNFGAVLQAWALNRLLMDFGYEARIINFLPKLSLFDKQVLKPSELAKKYQNTGFSPIMIASDIGAVFNYVNHLKNELHKNRLFTQFRKCFMRLSSKTINDNSELKQECLKYHICLVGSDQVWNPEFLRYSDFAYLLPFRLEGAKKIAFSASIAEDIPPTLIRIYKTTLLDFDFISLREKTHCLLLSSVLGKEVFNTLDPTLLLDTKEYEAIMNKKVTLPYDKYALVYNIGFSILPLAKKIVDTLKMPVILYNKQSLLSTRRLAFPRYFKNASTFQYEGPREFLTLLRNAEFIITNSYHGTILSILFEKPFITIIAGKGVYRKSRILDLLKYFELENRLAAPGKKPLREIICESINFNRVRKTLSNGRRNSLEILKMALES